MRQKAKNLTAFLFLLLAGTSTNSLSENDSTDPALGESKWDLKESPKGTLMFLDVPFSKEEASPVEYLTLAVAKSKSNDRPEFISVMVPDNIEQKNGIFIAFAQNSVLNGEIKTEIESEIPIHAAFDGCTDGFCTSRIVNGYAHSADGKKIDVYKKFMTYDHVVFLVTYSDGNRKTILVPLRSFKEQYSSI